MNYWEILGIERTDDLQVIKRAYAEKSKIFHPETHPEEFQLLHKAYKAVVTEVRSGAIHNLVIDNTIENRKEYSTVYHTESNKEEIIWKDNQKNNSNPKTHIHVDLNQMMEKYKIPTNDKQEEYYIQNEAFVLKVEQEAQIRGLEVNKSPQLAEFERMLKDEVFDKYWTRFMVSEFFLDRQYEAELIHAMAGLVEERILQVSREKKQMFYLPFVYMVIAYGFFFDKFKKKKVQENVYKKDQLVELEEAFQKYDIDYDLSILESNEKYLGERFAFYVYRNILEILESEMPDKEKLKTWLVDGLQKENQSHLLEITHYNPKERNLYQAKERRVFDKIKRSPLIYELMAYLVTRKHRNSDVLRVVLYEVCQMILYEDAKEEISILMLLIEENTNSRLLRKIVPQKIISAEEDEKNKIPMVHKEVEQVHELEKVPESFQKLTETKLLGKKIPVKETPVKEETEPIKKESNLKKRFRRICYFIPAVICAFCCFYSLNMNYYKMAYMKETPVSLKEAESDFEYYKAGYPAGKDIPNVFSVEEIAKYDAFSIEVSSEDIISTYKFRIKDITESGTKYYTSNGRRASHKKYIPEVCYCLDENDYRFRQIGWNFDDTSYAEYCVITLKSGERIFALIDTQFFDFSEDGLIQLPIGRLKKCQDKVSEYLDYKKYGVAKENGEWYVDMVGEWEDEEVGDRFQIGWYCLFFMATIVSISIGWLRIEEEKKEERKRIIIRRRVKF